MTDGWEEIQTFDSEPVAQAFAEMLAAQGVPAHVSTQTEGLGWVQAAIVRVPKELAHRARWILAQEKLSGAELEFLATGDLSAAGSD